jgi:phosphatidylinositol glycan class U
MLSVSTATEGVFLLENGISVYGGDTFHDQPIFLHLYRFLLSPGVKIYLNIFFISLEVVTAFILVLAAYIQLLDMTEWESPRLGKLAKQDSIEVGMPSSRLLDFAVKVGIIYLLCPCSILSSVGRSTSIIDNFLVSLLLLTATLNFRVLSCLVASFVVYHSLHAITLIIPVFMIIEQQRHLKSKADSSKRVRKSQPWLQPSLLDYSSKSVCLSLICSFSLFCLFLGGLIFMSYYIMDYDWSFIENTFLFSLTVPDLTPNIGLFWYFFTEMFEHFRNFFLCVFQINSVLYAIPLGMSLQRNPYFLFFINLILLCILKPYPSLSDIALYLSLIPQYHHLMKYTKQGLIIFSTMVTCSVLMPILWHLWIMHHSANSNFYFGVTLAMNTAQILLVADLLFSFTKREYYLNHGIPRDENHQPKKLELVYDEFNNEVTDKTKTE